MKKFEDRCLTILVLIVVVVLFSCCYCFADSSKPKTANVETASTLLDKVEKNYSAIGFSADFYQESPIPDLGISDTANGKAFFKKKEKFRWEYHTPEKLHYISDGKTLWIHNTEDNNVWIGHTDSFFGKGSGAGLLTDIKILREKFDATLLSNSPAETAVLELIPKKGMNIGVLKLMLSINKTDSLIKKIVTFNANNEETRIFLKNYNFKKPPTDALFSFTIPDKANVVPLDQ